MCARLSGGAMCVVFPGTVGTISPSWSTLCLIAVTNCFYIQAVSSNAYVTIMMPR
jgi:hypothetical protein